MPFQGPPEAQTQWTAIPRGLRNFALASAVISAKPLDDTHQIIIGGTLPARYAYVLVGVSWNIISDEGLNFDSGYIEFTNYAPGVPAGLTNKWPLEWMLTHSVPAEDEMVIAMSRDGLPTNPIWQPPPSTNAVFSLKTVNRVAAASAAGTTSCKVSFLEYTLTQAQRFGLNFPIPTQVRQ